MGKTPKPLSILVIPPLDQWEEIKTLRNQGHTIADMPEVLARFDLILGPACHRMTEDERKYLSLAIDEGRRRKYGRKG